MLVILLLASVMTFHLDGVLGDCRDLNQYCSDWAKKGECQNNPDWMKVNCRKSCELCGCRGGGCEGCRDTTTKCRAWAAKGECERNPGYMKVYCRLSCCVCHCATTAPPRPTPTTDFPSPPIPRTDEPPPPPIPTKKLPHPPLPHMSTTPAPSVNTTTQASRTLATAKTVSPPKNTTEVPGTLGTTGTVGTPRTIGNTTAITTPTVLTTLPTTWPTTLPTTHTPYPTLPASICNMSLPVGLQVDTFPSASFKASTSESRWHQPDQARLNCKPSEESVGAWCAGLQDGNQSIQVDLGDIKNLTAVLTQGRESEIPKFVTSYYIDYSIDATNWTAVPDEQNPGSGMVFSGNSDITSVKTNKLRRFAEARHIRIRPRTWHNMICMRLEFMYCADQDDTLR